MGKSQVFELPSLTMRKVDDQHYIAYGLFSNVDVLGINSAHHGPHRINYFGAAQEPINYGEILYIIECCHPYWHSDDCAWRVLNSPLMQMAQHKGTAIAAPMVALDHARCHVGQTFRDYLRAARLSVIEQRRQYLKRYGTIRQEENTNPPFSFWPRLED